MARSQIATDEPDERCRRAAEAGLLGVVENWLELRDQPWILPLIMMEEKARQSRGLQTRLSRAALKEFKLMADFDWSWPKKIDKENIMSLFDLKFATKPSNIVLIGPNGVGKTMIAKNLAYKAVLEGFTARFSTASDMLQELTAQDGQIALRRRLQTYVSPQVLVLDEVGYLSYDNRHADLLFDVVSRRYENKSLIITTNRPFSEWNQVFPNAPCVVALIDRLVHHADIISIHGDSWRHKEAREYNGAKRKPVISP